MRIYGINRKALPLLIEAMEKPLRSTAREPAMLTGTEGGNCGI